MEKPDTISSSSQIGGTTPSINRVMVDRLPLEVYCRQLLGVMEQEAGTGVGGVEDGQMFEGTDNTLGFP